MKASEVKEAGAYWFRLGARRWTVVEVEQESGALYVGFARDERVYMPGDYPDAEYIGPLTPPACRGKTTAPEVDG